jgi:hypothetical protein
LPSLLGRRAVSHALLLCTLQVCRPPRPLATTDAEWAALQARWETQRASPFVLYKLAKFAPGSGEAQELSEEDFAALEAKQPLAKEWTGSATERLWVKAALDVMRKVKSADGGGHIKLFLSVPVPGPNWPPALVENYLRIVLHPIDLSSIEKRLKEGGFSEPVEWESAVRRVFYNAFVYNNPDDATSKQVLDAAVAGSRAFEKEMMRLKGVTIV